MGRSGGHGGGCLSCRYLAWPGDLEQDLPELDWPRSTPAMRQRWPRSRSTAPRRCRRPARRISSPSTATASAALLAQVVESQRTYSDLIEEYIETLLELRHAEIEISGMMLFDGLSRPEPPTPGGHIDATPQPR